MTTYYSLLDDMEQLKAQMNILMTHLKKNEIITEEMVLRTTKNQMERILPSRISEVLSLLVTFLVIPGFSIYGYLKGDINSLPFELFTIAMCWYSGCRTLLGMRTNIRAAFNRGSLTEVAAKVAKIRRQNALNSVLTPIIMLIWCSWFLYLNYTDLLAEHNGLFMCFLIFAFVAVSIATGFYRIRRVTGNVLQQIEELKKE